MLEVDFPPNPGSTEGKKARSLKAMRPRPVKEVSMNDIVERLPVASHIARQHGLSHVASEIAEAAAYIQSLRTQLKERDEALEQIASCESHAVGDVVDIARKALNGDPS